MWVVLTDYTPHYMDVDTNLVGVFSSRETAIENAKVAMAKLGVEDVFDEDGNMMEDEGWEEMEDYSKSGPRADSVLYRVVGCGEGDIIQVRMMKSCLDEKVVLETYSDEEADSDHE